MARTYNTHEIGEEIAIIVGGAMSASAVALRFCHVRVETESAKAVRVTGDDGSALWLPKKSLIDTGSQFGGTYKLAHWLRLSPYASRFFARNSSIGGQSAA